MLTNLTKLASTTQQYIFAIGRQGEILQSALGLQSSQPNFKLLATHS